MKKSLLLLLCTIVGMLSVRADALHDRSLRLLRRLNAALVEHRCTDPSDPDCGALRCPACDLCHTRAAEALLPFACEYRLTGDRRRLAEAVALGDWLLRQQQADGSWPETPETWTGTTTDQLLMLALAYPIVEPALAPRQRTAWREAMRRAGDYLVRVMDNRFASINYCATSAATLAELHRLLPDPAYAAKARTLARMIVSKMNAEWFIEGEGGREGGYKYGVDIGYNLEMSLWGLARYALLTGDRTVDEAVRRSAAQHLWFIYPDGMLDASAGIRSNKWTLYGSGTSDGIHPLCALLRDADPAYAEAALRNIGCIERSFTRSGLLGPGPHYDRVKETPPCIYPTFAKAKSLATALLWTPAAAADAPKAHASVQHTANGCTSADRSPIGTAPKERAAARPAVGGTLLPLDADTCRRFRTLGITLVRRGPFCATVTASTYKAREGARSKYMHRPAGGACSALWVEGLGLVQASSQTLYRRWEPMSFPVMPEIRPLTPRIEATTADDGYCTNLYEFDARSETADEGDALRCTADGLLRNADGRPCGIGYVLTHRFEGSRLTKRYEILHHTADETVRIVEPILLDEAFRIERLDPCTLRLTGAARRLTLRVEGAAAIAADTLEAPRYRQIYPSLVALPLVIEVPLQEPQRRETVTLFYETE